MKPVVALVGKPNVGKSTLFNRLVDKKVSIIYGDVNYKNKKFLVIDTGGIDLSENAVNENIKMQAELAINEADVIVFVVDGKIGLDTNDKATRDIILKSNKKVLVVINKVDSRESRDHIYDFYELGLDNYLYISAEQNIGISDLLDKITEDFPDYEQEVQDERIKFSVIGRPNVGKSSLVNAIVGYERVLVSDVAGTTRDAIDTTFKYENNEYVVIDTAGMRKKGKIYESIERYSLLRALKAIDRSDVCLLVIDASTGIIEHDKHIASYAIEAGKALVIVVNKWDIVENKEEYIKNFTKEIRANFQFMTYAPIVFLSAMTKKRIHTLMPAILKVAENHKKVIDDDLINDCIKEAYALNLPPSYKGKRLKIYSAKQVSNCPPTFNISVNSKGLIHFSYERYLENKIRESFDLEGTPIVIYFKNKGEEKI